MINDTATTPLTFKKLKVKLPVKISGSVKITRLNCNLNFAMELITQTQVIDKHERPITCLAIESRKQFNGLDSGTLQEGFVLFSASEDGIVHQWNSQGEKVNFEFSLYLCTLQAS